MLKKLDCMVILVEDLKRTHSFYRSLGFEVLRSDAKGVGVRLGEFYMDFHTKEEFLIGERKDLYVGGNKGTGVIICVEVDDAQNCYDSFMTKGIAALYPPEKMPWGNIEFCVQDPDGYTLCFYELPEKKA
jgi:catechol 2,3-dioxygenase-like lactoylglutathione lyase family enzyme